MTSHISIYFSKVLEMVSYFRDIRCYGNERAKHTDTKKLVVPSDLPNIPGNSLSQVSSPYIINCSPFALI